MSEAIKQRNRNEAGLSVAMIQRESRITIHRPDGTDVAANLNKEETAHLAGFLVREVTPDEGGSLRTTTVECSHCKSTVEIRVAVFVPFKVVPATEKCPACGKRISLISVEDGKKIAL